MIGELFEALNNGLSGAPVWALAAAALWGVASMLLSPCHLAGIPLIVGFINGQGMASGKRAFALSGLFAVGILVTIAVIGVVTASLGRIAGDLGPWANYLVAGVFLLVGLYLLGLLPSPWKSPASVPIARKGLLSALVLGLVFGIALGPCTFAYMAPVLGVAFSSAATSPLFAASLLLAYGVGHCSVIVAAGSAAGMVQRYLDWNERSRGALRFRQGCGVLVIGAGVYLAWAAN
ncbi:cytochrome C biogenesis protein CcdA [Sulfurimicrobium lacus]|uniref:Cytochrome C biogenesis protein CcdA n=1 Tax=Sulfurimicrobium lacus TaxID=2715678 RepID=A0A6F8VE35_9PROT|nr:cytochrome c biogenesis protein CcdA [Sulfurimicrobium lacus]BCB27357.1 cytochrome C biogenesis protein CcdA [Sulfurimicrobium lacus]